jgi:MATE family multidrug resistance protein
MTLLNESKLTLRLALPLMIGQLSQMLLGVADTVMIGRLGVTELAALTFASALFHIPLSGPMAALQAHRGVRLAVVRPLCRPGRRDDAGLG